MFYKQLKSVAKQRGQDLKVTATKDRDVAAWKGGAVLAEMEDFKKQLLLIEHYDEDGYSAPTLRPLPRRAGVLVHHTAMASCVHACSRSSGVAPSVGITFFSAAAPPSPPRGRPSAMHRMNVLNMSPA